jgi:hypothetical protein
MDTFCKILIADLLTIKIVIDKKKSCVHKFCQVVFFSELCIAKGEKQQPKNRKKHLSKNKKNRKK